MSKPLAIARAMTGQEWALVIALSVLWGGSFFFNGVAVRELPTFTVVVARVALAALALYAIMRALGERLPRGRGVWLAFFGMGLLNNAIPFSLIVWGQGQIASGLASILNATTPLFGVVVAHCLTSDEKMTAARAAGVIVGFVGVAILMGGAALGEAIDGFWGQAACIGGAVSYAFAAVFGRRFRRMGLTPFATATGQVIASSAILLPIMFALERPWLLPAPSASALAALAGVALLSTALAYVLYFRILETAGASNLLLVTLLIPPTAILLGWAVLGENLEPRHLAGLALIGGGLAILDGRAGRFLRYGMGCSRRATKRL